MKKKIKIFLTEWLPLFFSFTAVFLMGAIVVMIFSVNSLPEKHLGNSFQVSDSENTTLTVSLENDSWIYTKVNAGNEHCYGYDYVYIKNETGYESTCIKCNFRYDKETIASMYDTGCKSRIVKKSNKSIEDIKDEIYWKRVFQ